MNRTTLWKFQPRSIALGLLMMVSPILADSALSQHACRIEEMADDLEDMIDDRFDRSPMYRPLLGLAEDLEHATDELENRIDDQDFGCARGLIAESQALGCQLSDLIASLPPCDVSPLHRERALQLLARIQGDLACLEGMLAGSRVSFSGRAPMQGFRLQVDSAECRRLARQTLGRVTARRIPG